MIKNDCYVSIYHFSAVFQLVPGLNTAKGLVLALQANDLHTKNFTLAILRLHENRYLEKLKQKWWETNVGCPQEQETSKPWFALARQAQAQATGMTQVKTKFDPTHARAKLFDHFKLFKHEVIWIQCFH